MNDLSRNTNRRGFIKLLGGSALAVAGGTLLLPSSAEAGIGWCRADPIVRLNGTKVQFWVSVRDQDLPYVNGPINCHVLTQKNVTQELLFLDAGFNGYGETLRFSYAQTTAVAGKPFVISVNAVVPHNKPSTSFPIIVDIVPENGQTVTSSGNAASASVRLTIVPTR